MREQQRDIYISTRTQKDVRYVTTKDILKNSTDEIIGIIGIVNTFQELSHIRDDLMDIQRIESVSQLAGGIAHDLNNILTNVVALSSMLLYIEQDEQKRGDLESIHNSARNASDLINKLRTFAKRTKMDMKNIDFNDVIRNTLQLVSGKFSRNFNIIENYGEEHFRITGDESQLTQLIMNLVINAFEAMDEGGDLKISTYKEYIAGDDDTLMVQPLNFIGGEFVCLEVTDQGNGIDGSIMSQIFDPYFTSKGEEGTGLGLSIVYGVLTAHEGTLRIKSEIGKGTSFFVYLPYDDYTTIDANLGNLE